MTLLINRLDPLKEKSRRSGTLGRHMHVLDHSPRLRNAEPRLSVSRRGIALSAGASADNTCLSGKPCRLEPVIRPRMIERRGFQRAAQKAPRRKRQCRSRSSRLSIVNPISCIVWLTTQSEVARRPRRRAAVRLYLSGVKSLDVLRDLAPLHASNSTSTTGSTAAVIIIQPIRLSNCLTCLLSSRARPSSFLRGAMITPTSRRRLAPCSAGGSFRLDAAP